MRIDNARTCRTDEMRNLVQVEFQNLPPKLRLNCVERISEKSSAGDKGEEERSGGAPPKGCDFQICSEEIRYKGRNFVKGINGAWNSE